LEIIFKARGREEDGMEWERREEGQDVGKVDCPL